MLQFSFSDTEILKQRYSLLLLHLKETLSSYEDRSLSLPFLIIQMLHEGIFSMEGHIIFSNDFSFFPISSKLSDGIHIPYGVACCRHATSFLKDVLDLFGFSLSYLYISVSPDGSWKKVVPSKANHVVLVYFYQGRKFILDAANRWIFEVLENQNLHLLNFEEQKTPLFQDEHISTIGLTLKKYYSLRELGVTYVYD